jgi:hypothetical protein
MDFKALLPWLGAAGGGFAGYYFSKGKAKKTMYMYAGGGTVAGFLLGNIIKKATTPVIQATVLRHVDTVPEPRQLPSATVDARFSDYTQYHDRGQVLEDGRVVNIDGAEDILSSMGSFSDSGEDGLGSYNESTVNGDIDIDEVFKDAGLPPPKRRH